MNFHKLEFLFIIFDLVEEAKIKIEIKMLNLLNFQKK